MPDALPPNGRWTADILEHLPSDRHLAEVINGQLHLVYGNESSHAIALWSLSLLVAPYAWSHGYEFALGPAPLRLSPASQVQPDIVVRPRRDGFFADRQSEGIELVVEIATPYSRSVDHRQKRVLYDASDVHQYWVVDYVEREVCIYRRRSSLPQCLTETMTWSPRRGDGPLTIDLQSYFDRIPDFDFTFDRCGPWIDGMASQAHPAPRTK